MYENTSVLVQWSLRIQKKKLLSEYYKLVFQDNIYKMKHKE